MPPRPSLSPPPAVIPIDVYKRQQVEGAAQGVLKQALEQADGLLGVVQVQAGGVPLGDDGL